MVQYLVLLFFLSYINSLYSQTCALHYPCPPPTWPVQWALNLSTICQPSGSDYFIPPTTQPWGLISLDWSNAETHWLKPNRNESTCEATSTYNAMMIKKNSPGTRVFVYHNMELALQWLESQRAYMYDPSKANLFLQYTDGKGNKNGTIYNEPRGEGDQYFWDFRVPEAGAAFIEGVLQVVNSPYVDGIFTDDVEGFPSEHPNAQSEMKLTGKELQDIQLTTRIVNQQLINVLIKAGKYNWQAFSASDGVGPAPSKSDCTQFMRKFCDVEMQKNPMTMQFSTTYKNEVLAAFLITRPSYAWLGYGWESDQRYWDPIFQMDVGVPQGLCSEGPSGVFQRKWSKVSVSLDCNNWIANFTK